MPPPPPPKKEEEKKEAAQEPAAEAQPTGGDTEMKDETVKNEVGADNLD